MRAAYYEAFGGPDNLKIGERPAPVADAAHMLVRTHAAGVGVVAIASSRNHGYVRDLGAEAAFDYHDPGFVEQLRSAVPNGFDVLFDGTGNEVRDQVLGLVRNGGRAIFIVGGAPPARDG